jgi:formylglycine-generating enzyme required for sulfatase activity
MTQAERATTIDLAQVFAQQAKLKADQVIELGIQDLSLKKLSNELKDLLAKLSQMEDTLIKAEDAYLRHKSWPVEAWTISKELRERFPSDPKVIGVANQLSDFKVNRTTLRFAFFLIVVMFLVFMANLGVNSYNLYILALTPTATSIIELNSTPSAFYTIDAVSSPTVEFSKNITTLPDEITDAKGVEMVLVPAGEFTMGSDYSENEEHPRHQVYLDDFYMDTYEVTNKLYRNCVDDYACTPPEDVSSKNRNNYFDNPEFNEFPVVYVNWEQAKTYCEWRGGHLPTEAQWEKAARGTDERIYPWGDNISCDYANYYNGTKYCVLETTKVGSYDRGKSIYGIYDLAGNVWEWVADRYDEKYYQNSPFENPSGPENGEERVFRGGAWDNHENLLYTFVRNKSKPLDSYSGLGFRCAKSANP